MAASEHPTTVLKLSGYKAEIIEERWMTGSVNLVVNGTPQSNVNIDDPSTLFFEYVQRIGHVIDQLPDGPITAVHLGAGALTLPRYVEATRPGSRQQVIELESELIAFVREHVPWNPRANIRVRHGDARAVLEKLPAGLRGTVDLLIVDVFSGAHIPAHVTSLEFYTTAVAMLAPGGVLAVNVADGPGLHFARGQAATLQTAAGDVAALAEAQILKGRRFGNIVLIASPTPLPLEWMPRLLAGGPHPARVITGRELRDWVAGAPIVTDATATGSPSPSKDVFRVGRD